MARSRLQVMMTVVAVALLGTASLAVIAMGGSSEGTSGGFLHHLHEMGHRLHHGEQHHDQMAELIEQLELTPDQHRHLEKIHEITGSHGGGKADAMVELHDRLVAQFEQGHVETGEIRQVIDGHVEQLRDMAYALTDELIALVNGLDERQREIVLAHIQEGGREHHAHGH